MPKAVIDSGTMISLSSTCLMNVFKSFVQHNKIDLMVSSDVARESVWRPITNKRFALNAARIKHAFNDNVVNVVESTAEVRRLEGKILAIANTCFSTKFGPTKIIQAGEAEALALAIIHGAKALFIDERTTRSLIENPSRLKQIIQKKQHTGIEANIEKIKEFRSLFPDLKIFRSVDLIAFAYKQDLFKNELDHGKLELEAALYAAKYAGCAVSEREINEYLNKK
ncbi:MAG: hypothetical protein HON47_01065 [Candidatus Diapherotrites archaeon]|jgi:hypothetical protein|uniref:Uncharacterized protein n=1 Tax=Candidatus Iainarchaeum sp. TaxID=3101447 RepID=A0A8T5GF29_9ARCH|nr:hypothetical protein [Candidatus Diapherotrites archaeon]